MLRLLLRLMLRLFYFLPYSNWVVMLRLQKIVLMNKKKQKEKGFKILMLKISIELSINPIELLFRN